MFRWLTVTLMSLMAIAILALAVGGWRMQTALANRLDSLTIELTSMNHAQERLLDRKPVEAPTIVGHAYLGDASRPAANAELFIYDASSMKLFRRFMTDATGHFRSNTLPAGDYFVWAPLLTAAETKALVMLPGKRRLSYYLQSQPLYVYPGTHLDPLNLDLRLDWGQISLEVIGPGPRRDAAGPPCHYRSQFVLLTVDAPPGMMVDPNRDNVSNEWPLRGRTDNGPWSENNAKLAFGGDAAKPLQTYSMLLPGEYAAAMVVAAFVDFDAVAPDIKNKSYWASVQRESVVGTSFNYPAYRGPKGFIQFAVKPGKRTHLRITISDELEARARDLFALSIDDFKSRGDDATAVRQALEPAPAVIEVVADQALLPDGNSAMR